MPKISLRIMRYESLIVHSEGRGDVLVREQKMKVACRSTVQSPSSIIVPVPSSFLSLPDLPVCFFFFLQLGATTETEAEEARERKGVQCRISSTRTTFNRKARLPFLFPRSASALKPRESPKRLRPFFRKSYINNLPLFSRGKPLLDGFDGIRRKPQRPTFASLTPKETKDGPSCRVQLPLDSKRGYGNEK